MLIACVYYDKTWIKRLIAFIWREHLQQTQLHSTRRLNVYFSFYRNYQNEEGGILEV